MAISRIIHDCVVEGRGGKGGPIVREIEEGWSHNHGSFYASVGSCSREFPGISYAPSRVPPGRWTLTYGSKICIYTLVDRLVSSRKVKQERSCFPWPSLARFQRGLGRAITYIHPLVTAISRFSLLGDPSADRISLLRR